MIKRLILVLLQELQAKLFIEAMFMEFMSEAGWSGEQERKMCLILLKNGLILKSFLKDQDLKLTLRNRDLMRTKR